MKKILFLMVSIIAISHINANESLTQALEERAQAVKSNGVLYFGKILFNVSAFYLNLLTDDQWDNANKEIDKIIDGEIDPKTGAPYEKYACFYVSKLKTALKLDNDRINTKLSLQAVLLEKSNANYFMALHDTDIIS